MVAGDRRPKRSSIPAYAMRRLGFEAQNEAGRSAQGHVQRLSGIWTKDPLCDYSKGTSISV